MFGNPETTTGGRALKFYASVRIDIRRIQSIKEGDRVVGSRTRAKVVKNKVAAPFREAEFDIIYGEGVSREGDLIDLGVNAGILEKSGTWISYKTDRLGQGRDNARIFLKENVDIRLKVENELRKHLGLPNPNAENGTGKAHAETAVKANGDAHKAEKAEVAKPAAAKAAAAGSGKSSR